MNIMYVSFDEVPSFKGASTHILSGLRAAVRTHTVHLVTLGEVALRPSAGLRHHPLALRERNLMRRALAFRQQAASLIRRLKPEVIHFRSPWEGIAAIEAGVPTVFEVNGLPTVELPYYYPRISSRVLEQMRSWEQRCLESAALVICPSERISAHIEGSYAMPRHARIIVMPNAYDPVPAEFTAPPQCSQGRPLRLVYLGTLSPWQGVDWSLKSFAALQGRCTLDLFAPYSKHRTRRLQRRINRLGLHGTVTLHEVAHRRALLELLPQYDFGFAPFLKTSRNVEQGCFPLKLLDYLSHGLPVIASDLTIARQLLIHRHNALLFQPNSTQSLTAALTEAAAHREESAALRARARSSLADHWTWDDYGARLLSLYQEATSAGAPNSSDSPRR